VPARLAITFVDAHNTAGDRVATSGQVYDKAPLEPLVKDIVFARLAAATALMRLPRAMRRTFKSGGETTHSGLNAGLRGEPGV